MEGVHLVYQYFILEQSTTTLSEETQELIKKRQAEYDHCLIANLCHEHVLGVHVLFEKESELHATHQMLKKLEQGQHPWLSLLPKFHPTMLGRRMRYSDAMQYANDRLAGKVVMILNADIYLGSGGDGGAGMNQLLRLCSKEQLLEPKQNDGGTNTTTVLSLTRHEHGICRHNKKNPPNTTTNRHSTTTTWCGCPFMKNGAYFGSHDSFIFIAPLDREVVDRCQHVQNRWGAEHKVINELFQAGYHVSNPSLTIHTYHHHATDIHPWRKEPGGQDVLADPRDHLPLPPTTL